MWRNTNLTPLPVQESAKNTTFTQLVDMMSRHLGHATFVCGDKSVQCDIVPLCSNLWLIPKHIYPNSDITVSVIRSDPTCSGGANFVANFNNSTRYDVPDSDFSVVYLPNGGSLKDIRKYLPVESVTRAFGAKMIYKFENSNVVKLPLSVREGDHPIVASLGKFQGVEYVLPEDTFPGQCGGLIICDSKCPMIYGVHLAGNGKKGAAGILTIDMVNEAYTALSKRVLLSSSEGTFSTHRMGVEFGPLSKISDRNASHWMDEKANFSAFGSHSLGTRTFHSKVTPTCISEIVEKVMGVPSKFGPPQKMNHGKHFSNDMDLKSHATSLFNIDILNKAADDFRTIIDKTLTSRWKREIKPLDNEQVLAGADGIFGIPAINRSTSMGFPINKPKDQYIVHSDREVEGVNCPLDASPEVWEEVEKMETTLADGERCYTIQRANLKDTPTLLTSEKVRVFSGCEASFLILVRRYYLPICRFIMNHPLEYECAVGVNAHGPEWTALTEHMQKYGVDRVIAGDYKKYDSRMASQIMFHGFQLLILIAERSGYSERDLKVMRGIATEICYPLYEHNGEFIMFAGSNPSGQPITVFLNNFVNSLYLRYAYYAIYKDKNVPLFADVVAVMCYGDDNKMSVREGFSEFNHTAIVDELAKVDVKYTMADKDSESVPYIRSDEATFLKRSSVWNEEVEQYFAPIEEDSIFKSLHCVLRSKVLSDKEHAAESIKGAVREFFFFGEETYNTRAEQLRVVAQEADITHLVGTIPSYAWQMHDYKLKYGLIEPEDETQATKTRVSYFN